MNVHRNNLLGIPVGSQNLVALTGDAISAIRGEHKPVFFACANPHSLVVARKDPVFTNALLSANHVVADGVGITLMARALGLDVGPRIAGSDYFLALMKALDMEEGGRVFFFGSSDPILGLIAKRLQKEFPKLKLAGALAPPMYPWPEDQNEKMIRIINAAQPDVLWVGMTAPKQEKWVYENRRNIDAPVCGCIGAVFDFYAGTNPRAPQWICDVGFEWMYRLSRSPRRLWKRTLKSAPQFLALCLWHDFLKRGKAL